MSFLTETTSLRRINAIDEKVLKVHVKTQICPFNPGRKMNEMNVK